MKNNKNYSRALNQLSRLDIIKLQIVAIIQFLLGLFDLLAIIVIGALMTVSIYGLQSKDYSTPGISILSLFQLQELDFRAQVAYLGFIAAALFIFKTVCSAYLSMRTVKFLAFKGAEINQKFYMNIFSSPLNQINKYRSQELIYASSSGVENLTTKLLGTSIALLSDFSLLVILFIGLLFYDSAISLIVFFTFTCLAIVISKITKHRAFKLGAQESTLNVNLNQEVNEFIENYREIHVKNLRLEFIEALSKKRFELAKVNAKKFFLIPLSKYVFEIGIVIVCISMAGFLFILRDSAAAISSLGVMIASVFRIAPAILRIQQGLTQIKSSLGVVESTIEIIEYFANPKKMSLNVNEVEIFNYEFKPVITVRDLEFTYSSQDIFSIKKVDLDISQGSQVAIVGPSGAGKSTLLDLLIGVIPPKNGFIKLSGEYPNAAIKKWPGKIAYLPQNTFIINGSFLTNITLSQNNSQLSQVYLEKILEISQLSDFINEMPDGIQTIIGQGGMNLSGGQKQRLGIARALFSEPQLIFLDEPTSSLDASTEFAITTALSALKGQVTTVIVAHRLSSVINSDLIVYMEEGKIVGKGNFEFLKSKIPNFEKQAQLLGL